MESIFPAFLILVFAAAFYFFWRWVANRLPAPALRRGLLNALICSVGVAAAVGLLTAGIWAIFKQSVVASGLIAFGIFWIFIFTAFIVGWLHARATSGPLLLDCGPHPTKKLFFFQSAFSLLYFGGSGLERFLDKSYMWGIAGMLLGVTTAIFCMVMAFGRLKIRENGIWAYWGLLKWNKLQSYKWEGDCLLIEAKTRFPWFGKGALPVPSEHKAPIGEYLATHCIAQSDA